MMLGFNLLHEFICSQGHINKLDPALDPDQAKGVYRPCSTCNENVLLYDRDKGIDPFGSITFLPSLA